MLKSMIPTETRTTMQVWADGENGDDDNAGLTESTAKKTVLAALNVLPFRLRHHCTLNLKNTFSHTVATSISVKKWVDPGCLFLIDGGDDKVTVAGPYTATSSDASKLTVSTEAWTVDQHRAYFIKITSGPCTGQLRMCVKSTATEVFPNKHFTEAPGLCTFDICHPRTQIGNTNNVNVTLINGCKGGGKVRAQRFYYNDPKSSVWDTFDISQITALNTREVAVGNIYEQRYNPTTWELVSADTESAGIGIIPFMTAGGCSSWRKFIIEASTSEAAMGVSNIWAGSLEIGKGTRIVGITTGAYYVNIAIRGPCRGKFSSPANYFPTTIEHPISWTPVWADAGGYIEIEGGVNFTTSSRYFIAVMRNSVAFFSGVVTGYTSAYHPVQTRNKTLVLFDKNNLPTLAGSGIVGIRLGGTTNAANRTWASLATTPYSNPNWLAVGRGIIP